MPVAFGGGVGAVAVAEAGSDPLGCTVPYFIYFSNFAYKFRRIPSLYYL